MACQRSCQQRAPSHRSQKLERVSSSWTVLRPPRIGDQGSRLIFLLYFFFLFFSLKQNKKKISPFPSNTLNPSTPPHPPSHHHPHPCLPPVCIHSAAVSVRATVETRFPARARKMAFLHAGFVYDDGCVCVRVCVCACAPPIPATNRPYYNELLSFQRNSPQE